ncbi:zn2cys6 transcription factor [Diaporthe amygdali]|uniref:zn2cys6 transcription factor n=1 Tax=Phomopsis amygdali TaxID=1214568 RepID=UPI0022FF0FD7|nr:zn2cys6 transcription factor [Diaporthe amygdali]KAJ0120813.1 zn2cys6 transcription factor [Diaporthe amygdali]
MIRTQSCVRVTIFPPTYASQLHAPSPHSSMATPIPGVQVQDNGSGSASTTTPTSTTAASAPGFPVQITERPAPVANMASNMTTMVFDGPGSTGKAVKRPRPVKSCNSCRQRKLRCDRTCPCSQCQKSNRVCKYANEHDVGPGSEGSDVEASPRPTKRPYRPAPPYPLDAQSPQLQTGPGTMGGLGLGLGTGVAAGVGGAGDQQQQQPRGLPGSVLLEQFGTRLDRLEKFVFSASPASTSAGAAHAVEWGPSRNPYAAYAAVTGSPTTIRSLSVKGNLRTRFFGQNSTRVLLNLFDEAREFIFTTSRGGDIRMLFEQLHKIHRALQEESKRALAPISVFTDSMLPVQKRMADILPGKAICDRLLEAYISMSEGIYRVIHVPTFKAEYEAFWAQTGVSDGFLPRLMCMLSLGARFETENRGLSRDRADGINAPTACALTRAWLDGLRGKQLVDMDTLQCEVLHLHASRMMLSRNQESWAQLGFIVRMAMTMGLHRDPDEFPQIRPFYAELRRRLWYTIVDMDLHLALACNLPGAVREGEYTCRPPSNLDDTDIFPDMKTLPPSRPIDEYTNTQLQAYASRTLPHRIRVSTIINRLDTIRDFHEVLDCGTKLEQLLDDVNHLFPRRNQTLDPRAKFKDWRMRALLDMHVRRPLLALYRPFALSTVECPAHITTSYLKSSMTMLTYMDELDPRTPGFGDVSHMYHVVLKHDIMQAAFSVCYFIRSASEEQRQQQQQHLARQQHQLASHHPHNTTSSPSATTINGQLPSPEAPHHDSAGGISFTNALDNRMVWSTQGMTRAVQATLDSFAGMIEGDPACDLLKDTVVLAVVLGSVAGGTADERARRVARGVARIVDAGSAALNASPETIASMPGPGSAGSGAGGSGGGSAMDGPYGSGGGSGYSPTTFFDDFSYWDMDQWDLATVPVGLS